MIALYLLAAAAVLVLLVSRICFSMAFHVPPSRHLTDEGEVHLPEGSIYVPYHDRMRQWALEKRALPQRHVTITSHDGLKLWASFFEFAPGAPVELMPLPTDTAEAPAAFWAPPLHMTTSLTDVVTV